MKKCTKCSRLLSLSSFYDSKVAKDGKHPWCKDCYSERMKDRYRTPSGRYITLKKDAKRRNITFSLTGEEYDVLYGQPCGYCGGVEKSSTGLDRIDNKLGYEIDNVIPSCKRCNYAKNTGLASDFYNHCVNVVKNFPDRLK